MSRSSSSTSATSSGWHSASTSTSSRDALGARAADDRIGDVYLSAGELATRVRELGAEIARDYGDGEPILVGALKASFVFLADLSRALPILPALDFVELAGYGSSQMGGHEQIRVLKDLDADIRDRDEV